MSKSNAYLKRIKDLATKNGKEGEQFLAQNALRTEVTTLSSGLQYEVLVSGSGDKPMAKSKVLCHYKGSLLDGTVFDSTYKSKRPAAFFVHELIKGWQEALPLMTVGSTWRLYIPPHLGYGFESLTDASGGNCTLVFDLELIAVL